MIKKITSLLRKANNKMFRRKSCRTQQERKHDESFRRQFEAAYPIGAKFLSLIGRMEDTEDVFMLQGSFISLGFISAGGMSTSYREWERKQLEDIRERYPDLKVIVIHADKEEADYSLKNLSNSESGNI